MTVELEEGIATPEWLLSHGFIQYKSVEEAGVFEIPFYNNDDLDLHFMEKEHDRNMFVVILNLDDDGKEVETFSLYVQDDAGCGFVNMPLRWSSLHIEYLQSIYFGIRGEYLSNKQTP